MPLTPKKETQLQAEITDLRAALAIAKAGRDAALATNVRLRTTQAKLVGALKLARRHVGVGYSAIQKREITAAIECALAAAKEG